MQRAVQLLNQLGGLPSVEEQQDGSPGIVGRDGPLGAVVARRPKACQIAEALVAGLVDRPVQEQGEQGPSPHCRFTIGVQTPGRALLPGRVGP